MGQVVRWFILCLQSATIVPTVQLRDVSNEEVRESVVFWPLMGFLLGLIAYGTQWVSVRYLHLSTLLSSVLAMTVYVVLTGGLHVDGVMDTADAIGSRKPRDIALDIMKDSRVGAMGVMVCVLMLMVRIVAVSDAPVTDFRPFLVVPTLSRLGMVWSIQLAPAARPDGLGAYFARKIPYASTVAASVYGLGLCVLVIGGLEPLMRVLVTMAMLSLAFIRWMIRKFGGMTGDTYGALNEILECVGWIVWLAK
jgi:adenosylcobinamide-GDP ribazoletransferase